MQNAYVTVRVNDGSMHGTHHAMVAYTTRIDDLDTETRVLGHVKAPALLERAPTPSAHTQNFASIIVVVYVIL